MIDKVEVKRNSLKEKIEFKWRLIKMVFSRAPAAVIIKVDKKTSSTTDPTETDFEVVGINLSTARFSYIIHTIYVDVFKKSKKFSDLGETNSNLN